MSNRERPARSHPKPPGPWRGQYARQVLIQVVPEETNRSERLDRLEALLSTALSRRLGQDKLAGLESSALPFDYPPNLSLTTDDRSNLPEGNTIEDP